MNSQNEYFHYALSWNSQDGFNWDLLQEVRLNGAVLSSYSYDSNFNRSAKIVRDKKFLFTYSEDNRLLTVQNDIGIMNYNYESVEFNRIARLSEQEDVVARVLYAEAGTSADDWQAVAWVVYNRVITRFHGKDTAYDVVTDGDEFTSYYKKTKEYREPDTTSNRWKASVTNAQRLQAGQTPSGTVSYINNQLFFRSVNTFISGYSEHGSSDSSLGGAFICDIAIPGVGAISEGTSKYELTNRYGNLSGVCNIYFNYV